MARATMSVEPPAGKGTTMVTGFSGQAVWAPAASESVQATAASNFFMGFLLKDEGQDASMPAHER
jgi:hypothetical protein